MQGSMMFSTKPYNFKGFPIIMMMSFGREFATDNTGLFFDTTHFYGVLEQSMALVFIWLSWGRWLWFELIFFTIFFAYIVSVLPIAFSGGRVFSGGHLRFFGVSLLIFGCLLLLFGGAGVLVSAVFHSGYFMRVFDVFMIKFNVSFIATIFADSSVLLKSCNRLDSLAFSTQYFFHVERYSKLPAICQA